MKAVQLINELKEALVGLKTKGMDTVPIDNLNQYLVAAEKAAEKSDGDARLRFEREVEAWKADHNASLELFKSVLEAGLNAIKSALVINGTAAVSLLAFLGNFIAKNQSDNGLLSAVGFALFVFVCSVGLAGVASGTRYLSQFFYAGAFEDNVKNEKSCKECVGHIFNGLSVCLVVTSFIGFFYGGWLSYQAIIAQ